MVTASKLCAPIALFGIGGVERRRFHRTLTYRWAAGQGLRRPMIGGDANWATTAALLVLVMSTRDPRPDSQRTIALTYPRGTTNHDAFSLLTRLITEAKS